LRDADIDTLAADGAQDTDRWADGIAAVEEAVRHLEAARKPAALVGGTETSTARVRWNSLVSSPAD
jgi:hypothetical protein